VSSCVSCVASCCCGRKRQKVAENNTKQTLNFLFSLLGKNRLARPAVRPPAKKTSERARIYIHTHTHESEHRSLGVFGAPRAHPRRRRRRRREQSKCLLRRWKKKRLRRTSEEIFAHTHAHVARRESGAGVFAALFRAPRSFLSLLQFVFVYFVFFFLGGNEECADERTKDEEERSERRRRNTFAPDTNDCSCTSCAYFNESNSKLSQRQQGNSLHMRTLVRVRDGTRDSRADDSVLRDVRVTSVRRADWEHSQRVRGGEVVREHAGWVFRG